jgi:lysophospholipase L1-like esterase
MRPAYLVCALFLAVAVAAPAHAADGVLVIGDSLEVGTGPYLRQELAGTPVTIDARTSRPSPEGVSVLRDRLSPSHRIVVFDIGVNDDPSQPQRLAADLDTVRGIVGERCLVVATVTRPPLNGVSVADLNRATRDFVAATPTARLADWHARTAGDPGLLRDGTHPNPGGYAVRARVIAGAVGDCASSATATKPRPEPPAATSSGQAPLVPAKIDWRRVSVFGPVAAVLDVIRGGAGLAVYAVRHLPGGSEPVLGAP